MDPRHQRSRRPVLEVRQVQPQEVAEHLASQHRVHAVSGVQDKILAKPTHRRVEEEEHPQSHGDRDQGAFGLMDNDLVDHHLGSQRCGEPDQLDEERGGEHVAPDAFVLEELRPEPAEAEFRFRRRAVARSRFCRRVELEHDDARLEQFLQRRNRRCLRHLAAGDEVEQPLGMALDEDHRPLRFAREEPDARKRRLCDIAFASTEIEGVQRLDELPQGMRRGIALQE